MANPPSSPSASRDLGWIKVFACSTCGEERWQRPELWSGRCQWCERAAERVALAYITALAETARLLDSRAKVGVPPGLFCG